MSDPLLLEARAPGKVILFGEHAVNRGQPALSAAVGMYTTCRAELAEDYCFRSNAMEARCSLRDLFQLEQTVEACRAQSDFNAIRSLAAADYFAPQKYVLAGMLGKSAPRGLRLEWESEIPGSSGLGSGAAAFTSMVASLRPLLENEPALLECAAWAQRGDIVAHGGVASGLDTQTSLLGGLIRYTGSGLAHALPCAPELVIVIAHTGVRAPTSEVNSRVREWLAKDPHGRLPYFQTVGLLSERGADALRAGDWLELGRLFNLNQLLLEKIGVSCPEAERLIAAALAAGAFGAKISGSGGGGIVIAVTNPPLRRAVADALETAGGQVWIPQIGVRGAGPVPASSNAA